LRGEFVLLFRFFAGGNRLAETTRMFAVERLDHGVMEGAGLEIVREHRRPGNGLQQRPMQTERGCQYNNEKKSAATNQHQLKVTLYCCSTSKKQHILGQIAIFHLFFRQTPVPSFCAMIAQGRETFPVKWRV